MNDYGTFFEASGIKNKIWIDFAFIVGSDHADIVPRKEANERCPQLVIKFYEDRIMWGHRTLAEILGESEPILDENGAEI